MEDIKMKEFKYVVTDNEGIHARKLLKSLQRQQRYILSMMPKK